MGDKRCGKTNLINKMLDISIDPNAIKETVALEYRFCQKKLDDQKIRVNFYELGGGKNLSNML